MENKFGSPSCFATSKKPRPIVRQVERRAEKESQIQGMGRCHDVRGRMREILKTKHGIAWYPPSDMNTAILFDGA